MYYLPEYTWNIVRQFLFRKKHPVAILMKPLCIQYSRPQIYISNYYKLRNGMFVKLVKPFLQLDPSIEKSIPFNIWFKRRRTLRNKILKNHVNPVR